MKSQRQAVRDYLRTGKTQRSSNFHIIDGHVFSYGWYKLAEIGYDTITLRKGPLYSPSTKRQMATLKNVAVQAGLIPLPHHQPNWRAPW